MANIKTIIIFFTIWLKYLVLVCLKKERATDFVIQWSSKSRNVIKSTNLMYLIYTWSLVRFGIRADSMLHQKKTSNITFDGILVADFVKQSQQN